MHTSITGLVQKTIFAVSFFPTDRKLWLEERLKCLEHLDIEQLLTLVETTKLIMDAKGLSKQNWPELIQLDDKELVAVIIDAAASSLIIAMRSSGVEDKEYSWWKQQTMLGVDLSTPQDRIH